MKTALKGALIAALLAGSAAAGAGTASAAARFIIGADGVRIAVGNGYWYDRRHHRRYYSYPSDWKTYNHPMAWYRAHPHWRDVHHHDWYRG